MQRNLIYHLDWGTAQHTTTGSANAGMVRCEPEDGVVKLTFCKDMSMPGDNFGNGVFLWGSALTSAVSSYVPRFRVLWFLLIEDLVALWHNLVSTTW
jgi:hypothetical protein